MECGHMVTDKKRKSLRSLRRRFFLKKFFQHNLWTVSEMTHLTSRMKHHLCNILRRLCSHTDGGMSSPWWLSNHFLSVFNSNKLTKSKPAFQSRSIVFDLLPRCWGFPLICLPGYWQPLMVCLSHRYSFFLSFFFFYVSHWCCCDIWGKQSKLWNIFNGMWGSKELVRALKSILTFNS